MLLWMWNLSSVILVGWLVFSAVYGAEERKKASVRDVFAARLIFRSGYTYDIAAGETYIGKNPDVDLCIKECTQGIEDVHGVIFLEQGRFYVEALHRYPIRVIQPDRQESILTKGDRCPLTYGTQLIVAGHKMKFFRGVI